MTPPPLSLYVHLPWCVRKCPYCDFNSHSAGTPPTQRYVEALRLDIELEATRADGRALETIFIGGGTPSLFSPAEIGTLLSDIRRHFTVREDAEVTMEANPGTVECGSPAGYRDAGVNRLSIGAQSFCNAMLKKLGRIHSAEDIVSAFDAARNAGFDNINIDIMHALPGQDVRMALADLHAATALEPEHVSWYQLTLEPNTVFHARPPADLPDEELAYDIQERGQAYLTRRGFEQYEVSAWARDGRRCAHNLNYWQFGDYLAVGAGAHGKLTDKESICRYRKPANPAMYMQAAEAGEFGIVWEALNDRDRLFEFMLNALRLNAGFSERTFVSRTGLSIDCLRNAMVPAADKGLISQTAEGRWRPTERGRRFLNDLVGEFLYAQEQP